MKRDMDLVREILLRAEELKPEGGQIEINGRSVKEVNYHIFIMAQNGLIMFWPPSLTAREYATSALGLNEVLSMSTPVRVLGLSWTGQDFLASVRNPQVYEQAKRTLLDRLGDMPFGILTELATSIAKQWVGLPV
jgi:hypothetical protein